MEDEEEQESDSKRLHRAVDEAVLSLNAGKRDVCHAVVGSVFPCAPSSNFEAPVANKGTPHSG